MCCAVAMAVLCMIARRCEAVRFLPGDAFECCVCADRMRRYAGEGGRGLGVRAERPGRVGGRRCSHGGVWSAWSIRWRRANSYKPVTVF